MSTVTVPKTGTQLLQTLSKRILEETQRKETFLRKIKSAENIRNNTFQDFAQEVRCKASEIKDASFLFIKQKAECDVLSALFSIDQEGTLVASVVLIPKRAVSESKLDISIIKSVVSTLQVVCGNMFTIFVNGTDDYFELSLIEFSGIKLSKAQEGIPM